MAKIKPTKTVLIKKLAMPSCERAAKTKKVMTA